MSTITVAKPMTVEDQKRAFAIALLKNPEKPLDAANSVIADIGTALTAATLWVNDPLVKQTQLDLIEQYGADKFIPTDVDVLKGVHKIAADETVDKEIRLKAYELYAKIKQRYFEKPNVIQHQSNILNQGVMQVVSNGTNEEWEKGLIEQQQRLVQDAS